MAMSEYLSSVARDLREAISVRTQNAKELARSEIEVSNGERSHKLGDAWVYTFTGDESALPEIDGVDIKLRYKGLVTDGRLLARDKGLLTVSLIRDVGIEIQHAFLCVDLTSYLAAVSHHLEQAIQSSPSSSLAVQVLGLPPANGTSWQEPLSTDEKTTFEDKAILNSVSLNRISLIQSRSRSRRTQLVTKMVSELTGDLQRVLIVTSLAIDLDRLVVRFRKKYSEIVCDGGMIRLGAAADPVFQNECAKDHDVASVANEWDYDQVSSIAALRADTQESRAGLRRVERVLGLFAEIRETEQLHSRLSDELRPHEVRMEDFSRELNKANKVIEETSAALERAKSYSLVRRVAAGLKPVELLQKLRNVDSVRRRIRSQLDILERSIAQKRIERDEAMHTKREIELLISGLSESALREAFDSLSTKLDRNVSAIDKMEQEHHELRQSIVKDSHIVVGTISDVLTQGSDLGSFDSVIVIVSDAQCIPELVALSKFATDKLIVAGDLKAKRPSSLNSDALKVTSWALGTLPEAYSRLVLEYDEVVPVTLMRHASSSVKQVRKAVA